MRWDWRKWLKVPSQPLRLNTFDHVYACMAYPNFFEKSSIGAHDFFRIAHNSAASCANEIKFMYLYFLLYMSNLQHHYPLLTPNSGSQHMMQVIFMVTHKEKNNHQQRVPGLEVQLLTIIRNQKNYHQQRVPGLSRVLLVLIRKQKSDQLQWAPGLSRVLLVQHVVMLLTCWSGDQKEVFEKDKHQEIAP